MEVENTTLPSEFILLAFYEWPHLHLPLSVIFLLVYLIALIGNMTIFVVISFSSHLHTPMYFLLWNLAVLHILLTSTIVPKLIEICLTEIQSISYLGCFTQVMFYAICGVVEFFLLAIMAYDRYVAICYPLRYSYLMNLQISFKLALTSWGIGLLESLAVTWLISSCSFTKYNTINHIFCDLESLLKLSSGNTKVAQLVVLMVIFICGFIPLIFILVTYVLVIYNILKIRSNQGKLKAFSTCSSHLTIITLFLIIILRVYTRPKSDSSEEESKILSLFYTCFIPTLSPIIYSLRNKDVHAALRKLRLKIQLGQPFDAVNIGLAFIK